MPRDALTSTIAFFTGNCLIEVFENVKYTVEVDPFELERTDNIYSVGVLGIDDTGETELATHRFKRKVAGYSHLVLNQKIAAYSLAVEPFISQRFNITIKVKVYIL